jgi:hypothetical protein
VDFGEFRVQIVFLVFDINDVHGGKLVTERSVVPKPSQLRSSL